MREILQSEASLNEHLLRETEDFVFDTEAQQQQGRYVSWFMAFARNHTCVDHEHCKCWKVLLIPTTVAALSDLHVLLLCRQGLSHHGRKL